MALFTFIAKRPGFAFQNAHVHEHAAPLFFVHPQQIHGGQQGSVVDAVVIDAPQACHHAPLVPAAQEAFPRGPQLGGEFVLLGLQLLLTAIGGCGARQVGVGTQALPLGAQLGVFFLGALARVPAA